ncbi:MAG: mevalonate kinase [Chloroflexota bacterium]|nr:mevalonate kinase [Chloroflexota bacterium]
MKDDRLATTASAPGKIILFGEHAVVYGRPAIAVPVFQVHAEATIEPRADERVEIDAADIARRYELRAAPPDDPIATLIERTCAQLGVAPRGFTAHIRSTIPVARGLGSGAAVSVAIARALGKFFATEDTGNTENKRLRDLAPSAAGLSIGDISALAYEVEKLHHGTPSGIDNTVIAYEQPVYFVRDQPIESFRVARPFLIAIADTGVASPTKIAVSDVRRAWESDRARYEALFDQIGAIARDARAAIERGDVDALGPLMNANQARLREIGVSSPEIETLVDAALRAGARGAKLSGAGRGGNVIALVDEANREAIERALIEAGAARVIVTRVE